MRRAVLLLATATLGLSACGSGSGSSDAVQAPPSGDAASTSTPAATTAAPAQATGDCVASPSPGGGKSVPCPTPTLAKGKQNVVVMKTSEGTFEITLDAERAPQTANAFAYLTKRGFYDGLTFHRVVKGFVIQGGDPNGDGSGGPGFSVTEAPPADLKYTRGVVAMAKTGAEPAGTSGSQFFVVTAADVGLPPDYALVGRVTKGLGTVEEITSLSQGDGAPPKRKITITAATLAAR
jgi:peptidyl-prolyl cis-trans isomerase B (cyclophilin B)